MLPIPASKVPELSAISSSVQSSVKSGFQSPSPFSYFFVYIFFNNIRILLVSCLPFVGPLFSSYALYETASILHFTASGTSFSPRVLAYAFALFGYPHAILELLAYSFGLFATLLFFFGDKDSVINNHLLGFVLRGSQANWSWSTYPIFCLFCFLYGLPLLFIAAIFESLSFISDSLPLLGLLWLFEFLVLLIIFSKRARIRLRISYY